MWGDVSVNGSALFLSGLVCLVAYYYFYCGRKQTKDGRLRHMPSGPPGWPILGNFFIFASHKPAKEMTKLKQEFGDTLLLRLPWLKLVVVQDYKLAKEALVTNGDKTAMRPRKLFDPTKRIWGDGGIGIFFNDGEPLKISRHFASAALRDFGGGKQTVEDKVKVEVDFLIRSLTKEQKVYSSESFRELSQMSMVNLVINICFGERFSFDHPEFLRVVRAVSTMFSISPMACPENFFPFLKYMPFYPNKLEIFITELEYIHEFMRANAESHRDSFDPSNIRGLTDLYLKIETEQKENKSSGITPASAFTSMVDLFIAGSDTVPTAISWIIFFLCNLPAVQNKVAHEIRQVVGVDRHISYSDRKEMPYTEAVINESLRLGRITPLLLPRPIEEGFYLGKTFIPKDSMLMVNVDSVHTDPAYWDDPDVFRPERWLDDDGHLVKHEAFIPFGLGIVMNEGDPHRIARRFASVGLRDFGVGKQSIEDKITEELEFLIGPLLNAEKVYSSVEFKEQTQMAMINIMNNILFGQRFSYDHAEFRRIVLAVGTGSSISPMACPENYLPFLKYLPFFHSKLEVFISETERVFNFMEASAESHRDTFDPSNIRDFTDLYLKQVVEQTGDDSNQITPKSAFTSMRDLFLAGGETSATVVEWMQLFLCNTPMTQKKVADEILKVVGVDRQISYSDRKEMPYTEAVINESLRLGNIIPMLLPHTVTESFVLKGRLIPKDSILIINADSIHMDRDYWGDPDVFRPERWLDDDGTLVKHEAFVPFGIGPRNCIGDQVAKKMLFLFLTNFVRQVKVSFPNKETGRSIEGHLGLIYKPEPYEMTITPRLTPLRESISSVSSVSV